MTWCRSDTDFDLMRRVEDDEACPVGFSPTFFGESCAPVPGCQLGSYQGFCVEFWIAVGLLVLILLTEKR